MSSSARVRRKVKNEMEPTIKKIKAQGVQVIALDSPVAEADALFATDTYKAGVMQAVLDVGADIINDVWALRHEEAQHVVAAHASCGVCMMHMHGEPQTMQTLPMQGSSIRPVLEFLKMKN